MKNSIYVERKYNSENEIVTHATKMGVSLFELAEKIGITHAELYSKLRIPMSATKKFEYKQLIDDIANEKALVNVVPELNFLDKGHFRHSHSSTDVHVGVTKRSMQGDTMYPSVTLRNGCDKFITNTEYVTIAIYKNRLYFKESDNYAGYKLYGAGKGNPNRCTKFTKVDEKTLTWFKDNIGDYDLQKDERLGLYFVEVES